MAKAKTRRTKAIVIGHRKLKESDLILTLLQEDGSQASAIAKGARKPSGKLASKAQLFCELDALIASGRSLDIITEAQLVEPHVLLRSDYDKMSAASAICNVSALTCFEDAQDLYLYAICSRALKACEQAQDASHLDLVVAAYVFKVLSHQGWQPVLDSCVMCGDEHPTRFSSAAGGALCSSCAGEVEGSEELDANAFSWLNALVFMTFDELLEQPADSATSALLLAFAHSWASVHLDARLKAFEFLLGAS